MPLASMTGLGSAEGASGEWTFRWELRSVNGKGLDARLRLPPGMDAMDAAVRSRLRARFNRGNVTANLHLDRAEGGDNAYRINAAWLDTLTRAAGSDDPRIRAALLAVKGVVEPAREAPADDEVADRDATILKVLDQAMSALAQARADEGARLHAVLSEQIDEIEQLAIAARSCDSARPEQRRTRLKEALDQLLAEDPPVPEERLAQELALQMVRGDIAEELDRLDAHVAQARALLASDEPVGRRLDFLSQEFNREANTVCSKSADIELTRIGMDLKTVIDRFREQVQNIE